MVLNSPTTYNRKDMKAMLASLPLEEKKWTLNYLVNILVVPPVAKDLAGKHVVLTENVLKQARSMSVSGYDVPADEDGRGAIADFKYQAV